MEIRKDFGKKEDILFICDFETTGVNPEKDYPIELGGIFVDNNLDIIDIFETLICPSDNIIKTEEIKYDDKSIEYRVCWDEKYIGAYNIHKINPKDVLLAPKVDSVVNSLLRKINKIKEIYNVKRIIITSDNAQFEFNFMKKLFKLANMEDKFPFHYSAWDVNICLDFFNREIGDSISVHRALNDTLRLYKQIIRFAEKIKYFYK